MHTVGHLTRGFRGPLRAEIWGCDDVLGTPVLCRPVSDTPGSLPRSAFTKERYQAPKGEKLIQSQVDLHKYLFLWYRYSTRRWDEQVVS